MLKFEGNTWTNILLALIALAIWSSSAPKNSLGNPQVHVEDVYGITESINQGNEHLREISSHLDDINTQLTNGIEVGCSK
jgi:hypothetical protein